MTLLAYPTKGDMKAVAQILRQVTAGLGEGPGWQAIRNVLTTKANELDPPIVETWKGHRIDDMNAPALRVALREACEMMSCGVASPP